jgi:hypothetical protein
MSAGLPSGAAIEELFWASAGNVAVNKNAATAIGANRLKSFVMLSPKCK